MASILEQKCQQITLLTEQLGNAAEHYDENLDFSFYTLWAQNTRGLKEEEIRHIEKVLDASIAKLQKALNEREAKTEEAREKYLRLIEQIKESLKSKPLSTSTSWGRLMMALRETQKTLSDLEGVPEETYDENLQDLNALKDRACTSVSNREKVAIEQIEHILYAHLQRVPTQEEIQEELHNTILFSVKADHAGAHAQGLFSIFEASPGTGIFHAPKLLRYSIAWENVEELDERVEPEVAETAAVLYGSGSYNTLPKAVKAAQALEQQ